MPVLRRVRPFLVLIDDVPSPIISDPTTHTGGSPMRLARSLLALVVALLAAAPARAAEDPVKPKPADPLAAYEAREHKSDAVAGGTLSYRLLAPAGYDAKAADTYPLLLLLHGAGERGTDNKA